MKRIAIIHYAPLEQYPPIQNLLNFLSLDLELKTYCYSTKLITSNLFFKTPEQITIVRFGGFLTYYNSSTLKRHINFLWFIIATTVTLFSVRPKAILYFETISSLPAIVYASIFRKTKVFIHYHEYTSPLEYKKGMVIVRLLHKLEQKFYKKAVWVSHTNVFRMSLFSKDSPVQSAQQHILPNYPPKNWKNKTIICKKKSVYSLVYVGYGLSNETMYVKEIFDWANSKPISLNFYLHTVDTVILELASEYHSLNVNWYPAVNYDLLPSILPKYDIGLILYRGTTPNYKFNAPNKLFEYLACGLDVWVPDTLEGAIPYENTETIPKTLILDFSKFDQLDWLTQTNRVNLPIKDSTYYCELVYKELVNFIKHQNSQKRFELFFLLTPFLSIKWIFIYSLLETNFQFYLF